MFTNEDYERLLVKYTSQGIPVGESIQHFCDRNKVPYNLFDNCKVIGEYLLNLPQ